MTVSEKYIIKKFLTFLSGDGITFFINVFTHVFLLRCLNPIDYGYYALGQTIYLWLLPLVQMSMVVTGIHLLNCYKDEKEEIICDIIMLRILLALIVVGLTFSVAIMICDRNLENFLIALTPVFIIQAFQLDFVAIYEGKAWVYSLSRITASGIFLIFVIFFLNKTTPIYWIPLFQCVGIFLSVGIQHSLLRVRFSFRYSSVQQINRWGTVIRLSWATIAAQFTQIGYYNIDLIIMGFIFHIDKKIIGEYAAVSRLIQIAVMPLTSVLMTIMPSLSKSYKENNLISFNKSKNILAVTCTSIGLSGALVLWSVGYPLLSMFSGREMPVSSEVFTIFSVVYFVIGAHSAWTAILPYLGLGNVYLFITGSALLTVIIMDLLLIPHFNYIGAGFSCLCGIITMLLTGWAANHRYLNR